MFPRRRVIGRPEDEETLLAQKDQDELRPQCNSKELWSKCDADTDAPPLAKLVALVSRRLAPRALVQEASYEDIPTAVHHHG